MDEDRITDAVNNAMEEEFDKMREYLAKNLKIEIESWEVPFPTVSVRLLLDGKVISHDEHYPSHV